MPRCSILFASERESLLALPDTEDERIRHSTFNASDLAIIRERRSPANCLGLAVQLCLIRDRSFEQQHSRASGLNLVTAVIVLWNIFYLEREANVFVAMARPSMTTCCNTCRRWTGNTST